MEREADLVADRIMRMPDPKLIQRSCSKCAEKEKINRKTFSRKVTPFIQRKENNNLEASDQVTSSIQSNRGNGSPLPAETRGFMENRFGTNFSNVRIHSGPEANNLSQNLNADAFTVGQDVFFNSGKYAPTTYSGKKLLAHELTHVVQQSNQKLSRFTSDISKDNDGSIRRTRTHWYTTTRNQPADGLLQTDLQPVGSVWVYPIHSTRANCGFTPLFNVPEFRTPDGNHRLTIRAEAYDLDRRRRLRGDYDWRMNVFESFSGGTPPYGCHNHSGNRDFGNIGNRLEVVYPENRLWSTRNLFVRFRNGGPSTISVRLTFVYPQPPQPSATTVFWDSIQHILQLLGLAPGIGIVFDGADLIISAARRRWESAGFALMAMAPVFGTAVTGARTARRIRILNAQLPGGLGMRITVTQGDIIGLRIPQSATRHISPAQLENLLRTSTRVRFGANEFFRIPQVANLARFRRTRGSVPDQHFDDLLSLALHTRSTVAGMSLASLRNLNVLTARVRIGNRVELLAFQSTTSRGVSEHTEQFLIAEMQRIRNAHPNENVILDMIFSERIPCNRASCSAALTSLEREQVRLFGQANGRIDVRYGVPTSTSDRARDVRSLYIGTH